MAYQAQGSDLRGKLLALFHGAIEVNRPILFAAAIIIAGFIPLFTLSGVEGHIFAPMAKTYAYAIAGGLIATFTITPAMATGVGLARGHEQGPTDQRNASQAPGRIPRSRIQFLAIPAGQRLGGRLGRERREFDQTVWRRP